MTASVGVVIPAYKPNIEELRRYSTAVETQIEPDELRIELDKPSETVQEQLHTLPATVNVAEERRGKGAAITAGFEALSTDVLAFADADGATPARELKRIIQHVETGEAELAIGSRRRPESTVTSTQTPLRKFIGDVFVRLAQILLNNEISDYQCGAKAITADTWHEIRRNLYEPRFAWDLELIAVTLSEGFRIAEVPIEWEDKPGSTVSPIDGSIQLFRSLVELRYRTTVASGRPIRTELGESLDKSSRLVNQAEEEEAVETIEGRT